MAEKLIPIRASDLPECQELKNAKKSFTLRWFEKSNNLSQGGLDIDNRPLYCGGPYVAIQGTFRDIIIALALAPASVSEFT